MAWHLNKTFDVIFSSESDVGGIISTPHEMIITIHVFKCQKIVESRN